MGWFYKQIHWTQDPYTSDVRFIDPGSGFMFSVPYPVERDEVAKQLVLYKLTQRLIS